MAFVPETGDGVSGANAFFSVEAIDAYHNLRRNIEWADKDQADKEGAIIDATDVIIGWNKTYLGEPKTAQQSLPFPRSYTDAVSSVVIGEEMPNLLLRAVAELALIRVTKGPLVNRNVTAPTRGALIRKKTDVLESQWQPLTAEQMSAQPVFDWIEDIIAPLVREERGMFLTVARA